MTDLTEQWKKGELINGKKYTGINQTWHGLFERFVKGKNQK